MVLSISKRPVYTFRNNQVGTQVTLRFELESTIKRRWWGWCCPQRSRSWLGSDFFELIEGIAGPQTQGLPYKMLLGFSKANRWGSWQNSLLKSTSKWTVVDEWRAGTKTQMELFNQTRLHMQKHDMKRWRCPPTQQRDWWCGDGCSTWWSSPLCTFVTLPPSTLKDESKMPK